MATETITQAPWSGQAPYLKNLFQGAQQQYNQGAPKYFPGNTVAPFGQQTQQALGQYMQNAQNPMQANALNQQMTGTLGGQYLNSNPYLDAMSNNAGRQMGRQFSESIAPSVGAGFDSAGRYGSGLYQNMQNQAQEQLGTSLGDMNAQIYGQNYANERQNQMRAAALAPQTIPMNDYGASQMLNVGQMYDQQAQREINADYQRYAYNQERPWDALGRFGGLIQGNYGGTSTAPLYEPSGAQNALGWGALGAGVGNWLGNSGKFGFGGTSGALGGAGLGALGGWLFG